MLKRALSLMLDVFQKPVLSLGQACFDSEDVLTIRMSDGLLKARVMGKANQIHDVFIDFKAWPSQPANCTCSKKHNCEHVVACLLALQAKEKLNVWPAFQDRFYEKPAVDSPQWIYSPTTVIDADSVTWYSESHAEGARQDFFAYELGILIDGKPMNIVPWIVNFIERYDLHSIEEWSKDELIQLPLGDGRVLALPVERIRPFIRLLLHYGLRARKRSLDFRLTRHQLLFMFEAEQAMHATNARWSGTNLIQDTLKRLCTLKTDIEPPKNLKAVLRDYQLEGLSWLSKLREGDFGGVLADDMGLGKTIQTLALLLREKEQERLKKACLIIAPTSVIGNWREECTRYAPDLKVLLYHGVSRTEYDFDDYELVLSTYGLVQRDKRRFVDYNFHYLILDEAQFIKNTQTKTRQIIQQLQATHRLCLTGTPIENHLGELWSLFHFLMPGLLGDKKQFRQFFKNPIEKDKDEDRRHLLIKRIQPFLLRRTKNEVARELPSKTEITLSVELTGTQRELYEMIRMNTEQSVREAIAKRGLMKSHLILLDALLKLRQICCDPRLLKIEEALFAQGCSVKLDACLELLDNLMEEGRSVLVFSQFTSMLSLIENALNQRGYSYLKLTGKTQNRQALVKRFQEGEVPIFLISLKAGGTGLNLTQADTVIHYDPWWNPAVEDQATDRSHRIGQTKPVFVYRLVASNTVEEVMVRMQTAKRDLFQGVLSSEMAHHFSSLTNEDIDAFFAALR